MKTVKQQIEEILCKIYGHKPVTFKSNLATLDNLIESLYYSHKCKYCGEKLIAELIIDDPS